MPRHFDEMLPVTTVFLGNLDSEQAEFAATSQQSDRNVPVLVLDLFDLGQHLVFNELFGHVPDHRLFFGEIFRCEDVLGGGLFGQEAAALLYGC